MAGHVVTSDPDLHILADGNRIEPVRIGKRRFVFVLPEGANAVTLASRTFVPAHVRPASADKRTLGVCVKRLQIDDRDVALDDPSLASGGWNALERRPERHDQRWTKGRSTLPPSTRLVVIDIAGDGSYWQQPKDNVVALFRTYDFIEKIWSGRRDSNPRPQPWQGCALPLSYTRIRATAAAARGLWPSRAEIATPLLLNPAALAVASFRRLRPHSPLALRRL